VSLRTNPVNLRAGPGVRYPVEWVYVRRGLPVEVTAESDVWRRVRDVDGTEGWVHQTMLSGRRAAVIRAATGGSQSLAPLRTASAEPAVTVAQLEPGVVVTVQRCPAGAAGCRVEVAGQQGWLDRARLWGVYPDEIID
jgi:SH3-like domain-containing protein